ncbi:hypothetical protein As57867_006050, partial [Aphanomyces stellatus]
MAQKDEHYVNVETPKGGADPLVSDPSTTDATPKPQMASFTELFQFADTTDIILMSVGTLGAMIAGVGQPVQITFFGDIINAFNPTGEGKVDPDVFQKNINHVVYQFIVLASVLLVGGFLQIACWSISASRQAKRLRHAYASAILRQEVGWFDVNEPMQLATRVA